MGLDEFVHKFGKISDAATKEFNLEKSMKKMVEEWSDMEFNGIQVLLDDHIVKTQTMRGSPYIKPFEEQIGKWEERLLVLQEIMDEWLKRKVEDSQLLTKNWRDIMKAATVDKHVLVVVEIDRILEKLKKSNELLDLIGKGLNDYLERKRLCFPRFFFLSNSELLEILSETKDPTRVKPHLKKCFEGIASLDFDSDLEVTNIKSEFGEIIPLIKAISTVKARGQVDKWLVELEIQMKESLKAKMMYAVKNYSIDNIEDHLNDFPSQALSCVNYIFWTSEIHNAIDNSSLKEISNQNEDFILKLSDMILSLGASNITSRETFLKNIILAQGYFRGIIDDLNKNGGGSEDFCWLSRLRYYWINEDVELHMAYSKIKYGYEYLSQYSKLVMIPLTEKCYRILLMALDLHQGGIVSGDTATGKTETIKDLSKAVAKQCVGFNCSEDPTLQGFRQIFKRLGFLWCMCAIFVTTDSLQTLNNSIPYNVRSLFRPVAMASPDGAMIAELTLLSHGFKETKIVSSKNSFYGRTLSAGTLKKTSPLEDENIIICKAIHTVKYCELLPQDQEMFKNILFHLFGLCPPDPIPDDVLKKAIIDQCQKHNLESTPYFLSKVQQLYDMMDLCDGVMLLGGSFGGKTLACKILASGLNTVSGKSPHMVVVNPKAIKIDQMYGYFDNDEWVDGILAKNFRQFTSLPSSERKMAHI
ncbi:DNAH [Lepeophtheirus salmonis]|nr:DNAH [Lepeophtheirus salmonis]CAF2891652.1 DNAH [Lepeophtheirus salmonis]